MAFELFLALIMPYAFFMNSTYQEKGSLVDEGTNFYINDLLLCFMIFTRIPYLIRSVLSSSEFA